MSNKKQRVLLKISGESLCGEGGVRHNLAAMKFLGEQIVSIKDRYQLSIVVGGGPIRGSQLIRDLGVGPDGAHNVGMAATAINGRIFQEVFEREFGVPTRHMVAKAIHTEALGEVYITRKAVKHMEADLVVLLSGGTGSTNLSTDAAMVSRALDLEADIVLKGTKVDGIFDVDPKKTPGAIKFDRLTYGQYLDTSRKPRITVIDPTAVTMARDGGRPMTIKVFNIFKEDNLRRVLIGEPVGSEIVPDPEDAS